MASPPAPQPEAQSAAQAPSAAAPSASPVGANQPVSACVHEDGCAQEAPPTEASKGHFGETFSLTQSSPLDQAVQAAAALPDGQSTSTIQVKGTIGPVCQKKGCWMMLQEGDTKVRVIMARGAFSVPRDGQGKPAIVEGTLKSRLLSSAQVEHLAQDERKEGEGSPAAVDAAAPRREYILTARAVEVL